jgi:hypothetical protein
LTWTNTTNLLVYITWELNFTSRQYFLYCLVVALSPSLQSQLEGKYRLFGAMSTDTDLKESDSVQDQGESAVVLPAESPSAPPSTPKDEHRIEAAIPPARFWTLSLG